MRVKTFCLFMFYEEAVEFAEKHGIPTRNIRAFDCADDMDWAIRVDDLAAIDLIAAQNGRSVLLVSNEPDEENNKLDERN